MTLEELRKTRNDNRCKLVDLEEIQDLAGVEE